MNLTDRQSWQRLSSALSLSLPRKEASGPKPEKPEEVARRQERAEKCQKWPGWGTDGGTDELAKLLPRQRLQSVGIRADPDPGIPSGQVMRTQLAVDWLLSLSAMALLWKSALELASGCEEEGLMRW